MEKISSIIPTNHRVKSVDMEDSQPVRPGAPSFGRPVGTTSSYREQVRNHLAEQKAAELLQDKQDSVTISNEGKQVGKQIEKQFEKSIGKQVGKSDVAESANFKGYVEKEIQDAAVPMKSFVEEVAGAPSFFIDTQPHTQPRTSVPSQVRSPISAAVQAPTQISAQTLTQNSEASAIGSARSLDKYA